MIIPLNYEDALYIAFHMREIDVREIFATRNSSYRNELAKDCVSVGGYCLKDSAGVPVAMFGYYQSWQNVLTAWMMATDEIGNHGVEITKASLKIIKSLENQCHRMQAFSADFHTVSHKWLEVLGFKKGAVLKAYGKNKENFIIFERM